MRQFPNYLDSNRSLGDMGKDSSEFNAKFENSFGSVAFTANRHLIEHMVRTRRELDIDYDTLVVWGILAHLNVAHMIPSAMASSLIEVDGIVKSPETEMRPLRLRDLEQVTGLPRETIRRKLGKLKSRGYILQTDDGWIINRDAVDQKMREFTRITVLRLLDAAKTIHTLLDNSPVPPLTPDAP